MRAARRDTHSSAASESRAAGISQETWPPNSELEQPEQPGRPAEAAAAAATLPPPIEPVSDPSSRPRPL